MVEREILALFMGDYNAFQQRFATLNIPGMADPLAHLIWSGMNRLWEQGKTPFPVAIFNALDKSERQALEEMGGVPAIQEVMNTPHSRNAVDEYIQILNDQATAAMLRNMANTIEHSILEGSSPADVVQIVEQQLTDIAARMSMNISTVSMGELYSSIVGVIKAGGQSDNRVIYTGIASLDQQIFGITPGRLMMVGMPSHHGKTMISMNIAINAMLANPKNVVLFISGEQGPDELSSLMVSMLTGPTVPWKLDKSPPKKRHVVSTDRIRMLRIRKKDREERVRQAKLPKELAKDATAAEIREISNGMAIVNDMRMEFNLGHMSLSNIRSMAMRMVRSYPDAPMILMVVDYIDLVTDPSQNYRPDDSVRRLDRVANTLKSIVRNDMDGRGAVIMNAQINREAERKWMESRITDSLAGAFTSAAVRGSGGPFQASDMVLLGVNNTRHPRYNGPKDIIPMRGIVIKNRQTGNMGPVSFHVDPRNLRVLT